MSTTAPATPLAFVLKSAAGISYLSVLIAGIALSQLAQYLFPTQAFFKGQALSIVTTYLFLGLSIIFCLFNQPKARWSNNSRLILLSYFIFWACALIIISFHQDGYNYTVFVVPVLIAMMLWKPLDVASARQALDTFGWSMIAIAVAGQLSVAAGFVIPRTEFPHRFPLLPLLGQDARWEGPFGNVNYSGPIGTYLVVYGLATSGVKRIIFVASGIVFLFASESRGAFAAAFIGVVVIVIMRERIGSLKLTHAMRITFASGVGLIAVVAALMADPTLNGRTTIWQEFAGLWWRQPWLGFSRNEILENIANGSLSFFSTHGHNLFVESLISGGILGFVALCTWLILSGSSCIRAARRGWPAGLAVFVSVLVASFDEDLFNGSSLSVLFLPIFLAVTLSMCLLDQSIPVLNADSKRS